MSFVAGEAGLLIHGKNLHPWWLAGVGMLKLDRKKLECPKVKEEKFLSYQNLIYELRETKT